MIDLHVCGFHCCSYQVGLHLPWKRGHSRWLLCARAIYQVPLLPRGPGHPMTNLETVLQCPCRTICSLSVWLSPHQPSKPHLRSYPVVISPPHLWSSSEAICASRLAAYQDIVVDDDPDLPFNVEHYSQVHEKNQVDFFNPCLFQSYGLGHTLLPSLSQPSFFKDRSMMLSWLCSHF